MKGCYRLVHISDLHAGHVLGATPPRWWNSINRAWLEPFWKRYVDVAKQIGTVDAVVANGDLIDGPGYKDSTQHITTDVVEQISMAAEVLGILKTRSVHIVRGTGYHVDSHGSLENLIAEHWSMNADDELRVQIYDVLCHFRHVVGRSDTPYAWGTQDAKEMINDVLQAELEEYDYADLLGRAHVHYSTGAWRWNTKRQKRQEIFTNPAMQLRGPKQGSYVRGLRTWQYHAGLTVIDFWRDRQSWDIQPVVIPIKVYAPQMRDYLCLTK